MARFVLNMTAKDLPAEYASRLKRDIEPDARLRVTVETVPNYEDVPADINRAHVAAIEQGIAAADAGCLVPHDRVMAWASALGTEDEFPLPTPDG